MGKSQWLLNMLEQYKACLGMIMVQLAYAGMAMFSKAAIDRGMSPYIFVVYRQAFATITLAPFAFFLDRKNHDDHPLSYTLILKIFLSSLFGITLSSNLYSYAINYVSATFASVGINTIPALTFLIAVIFRIEACSIRNSGGIAKLVGSVLSLSGAMVFAFVKGPVVRLMKCSNSTNSNNSNDYKWIQGCMLMLAANFIWASWFVMQAPLVKQYPAKFRLIMLQCFFSCTQSSIWAMSMERDISSWRIKWDLNLFSVAYCGVVVTGISFWLQLWAVEKKGPFYAAAFTPLILIFTALFSLFLWNEMLYVGSFCGGILLIAGLYCVIWGKNKETQMKENQEKVDIKEEMVV
ncbi:WAT1-related protein At1g43650-like [Salvia miltiorrhiza]|uniref:WAT1-related protein At1g43650-like n=1 Tax=Salvia miltiorrhiza TaxID=226208 RepID=UPI0025AD80DC|nr:WAT1-related protein At1g43650-like [Salvia miltiorrhiza]